MTRYNSYRNTNNEITNITSESRNSERVAEVNRTVNDMRSEIMSLKIMIQAMMEIMVDKGIDPDLINTKIQEITDRPETFDPVIKASQPCPRCGRMVLDNGGIPLKGTCLYCGAVVKFPPEFVYGSKKPDDSGDDQNTMPI